jgi:hypothetical protein
MSTAARWTCHSCRLETSGNDAALLIDPSVHGFAPPDTPPGIWVHSPCQICCHCFFLESERILLRRDSTAKGRGTPTLAVS